MNTTFQGYNIVTATQSVFRQYAGFSGRATRSEYWWWCLVSSLISFAAGFVFGFLAASMECPSLSLLANLVSLALFVPGLAVFVRRMHDIGRSGWNFFWSLLPVIGAIILLVYCCTDSQGANQYGPSEKYPS